MRFALEVRGRLGRLAAMAQRSSLRMGRRGARWRSRRGFALIFALTLMGFVVLLVITLSTLSRVESGASDATRKMALARQHALVGMRAALGRLQETTGPDLVSTARLDLVEPTTSQPLWTIVVDENGDEYVLVSGAGGEEEFRPGDLPTSRQVVMLDGERHGLPDDVDVIAGRVELQSSRVPGQVEDRDVTVGHYAWWISDEGVKASVGAVDRLEELLIDEENPISSEEAREEIDSIRRQVNTQPDISQILPALDPDDAETRALMLESQSRGSMALWPGIYDDIQDDVSARADFNATYPHITFRSRAVLANRIQQESLRGLRQNLSALLLSDDPVGDDEFSGLGGYGRVTPPMVEFLTNARDFSASRRVYSVPYDVFAPSSLARGEPYLSLAPIITEVALWVGVFHNQPDGLIRIRYHMGVELWNPYAWDFGFTGSAYHGRRGFVCYFDDMPEMRVIGPGSPIEVPLSNFPRIINNDAGETTMVTWLEIPQRRIRAGEVVDIQLEKQDGLARNLSRDTWTYSEQTEGHLNGSLFEPTDWIVVELDAAEISINLVPYQGGSEGVKRPIDEYGAPILSLQNIPFDSNRFRVEGSQFTRDGSGTYTQRNYLFAYYLRLRDAEDRPGAWGVLENARESGVLRNPVLDFSDPRVAELYEITSSPREAKIRNLEAFGTGYDFEDGKRFRMYEMATDTGFLASMRSLPVQSGDNHAYGGANRNGLPGDHNAVFDRYYMGGFEPAEPDEESLLRHPSIVPVRGAAPPLTKSVELERSNDPNPPLPAIGWLIDGAFNVNSTSVEAWTSVLSKALGDRSVPTAEDLTQVFTLPFALNDSDRTPVPDSQLRGTSDSDIRQQNEQGIRLLTPDQIEALSGAIVGELQSREEHYTSIQDFLDDGVIEAAIESTGLNSSIMPLTSAWLEQSALFAGIADFAVPRSDTFLIRSYGEVTNPVTGRVEGRAWCEAEVQRLPDFVNSVVDRADKPFSQLDSINEALGREYRIVSFRWLSEDEI